MGAPVSLSKRSTVAVWSEGPAGLCPIHQPRPVGMSRFMFTPHVPVPTPMRALWRVRAASSAAWVTARATAVAFVITAIWWLGVSLPLLRAYRQVHFVPRQPHLIRTSFRRLGRTLADIRGQKQVFLFLLAFFFYIDGVYTIIDLADQPTEENLAALRAIEGMISVRAI